MISPELVAEKIRAALPDAKVIVRAEEGHPEHLLAWVASDAFVGKSLVQQHQMVYAPLREHLSQGTLHALALKTTTLDQWREDA